MNTKKKTASIALIAIMTIGLVAFTATSFHEEQLGIQTNPNEFTNENYYPVHAQYVSVNAIEIASLSDNVVKGQIVNIEKETVPVTDRKENVPIPTIDRIIYTVEISENIKGDKRTMDIVTVIPSKISYNLGDKVLVMTSSLKGENMLLGGPHSMYKLKDGKAVGDELTFDENKLSQILKSTEDRSSELAKSKGS